MEPDLSIRTLHTAELNLSDFYTVLYFITVLQYRKAAD